MERLKKYYKPLLATFGAGVLTYLFFRLYKKTKAIDSNIQLPLRKEDALYRSRLIQNLKYTLFLQLRPCIGLKHFDKKTYDGSVLIEFNMSNISNIFLDFTGQILKLTINSQEIKNVNYKNGRIYLPSDLLTLQNNKVHITFANHYSSESLGLRYYTDVDSQPYIYSNFEPFSAHTMFPCFDQPNLKAPIKLLVACPSDWKVISSSNEKELISNQQILKLKEKEINLELLEIPKMAETFSLHDFEVTPEITTYAFALCAGRFVELPDFAYDKDDKLPAMTVYCRESIANGVDVFDVYKTAKASMKWYRENLTSNFFYSKFDFVFVPDLKIEAMENIGCITFDDKFLEPNRTPIEKAYFHNIISHEIAHTWFGNVITPEWWDDLWLNESFATFLSFLCLKQISETEDCGMEDFNIMWLLFSKLKFAGIIQDQYKTTHKIRDNVEDTSHAQILFDEITYYKGAAILKYYYYCTGHELFFKGLQRYISGNSQNANYNMFKAILDNLSESRGMNQSPLEIIEPFLIHPGVTQIKSELKVNKENTLIDEFYINQRPCSNATADKFYSFITNILLVYEGKEVILNNVQIVEAKESTIKELKNLQKPLAVVLNAGDWTYFKQEFDHATVNYLVENAYKIKDATTRLVIVRDMFEMIKDGLYDPESYLEFTKNLLNHEKEYYVVVQLIQTAIYTFTHFVESSRQKTFKDSLFHIIREDLYFKHREIRKTLMNFLLDLTDSNDDYSIFSIISILRKETNKQTNLLRGDSEIYEGEIGEENHKTRFDLSYFDESTKFRLLETIAESQVLTPSEKDDFEKSISQVEVSTSFTVSRDNSSTDIRNETNILTGHGYEKLTIAACRPDMKNKERLWNKFVNKEGKHMLNQEWEAEMKGFARKSQFNLLKDYFTEKFFDDFISVKENWGEEYASLFYEHLNPGFIVDEIIYKKFINLAKLIRYNEYNLQNQISTSK